MLQLSKTDSLFESSFYLSQGTLTSKETKQKNSSRIILDKATRAATAFIGENQSIRAMEIERRFKIK